MPMANSQKSTVPPPSVSICRKKSRISLGLSKSLGSPGLPCESFWMTSSMSVRRMSPSSAVSRPVSIVFGRVGRG